MVEEGELPEHADDVAEEEDVEEEDKKNGDTEEPGGGTEVLPAGEVGLQLREDDVVDEENVRGGGWKYSLLARCVNDRFILELSYVEAKQLPCIRERE